MAYDDGDTDAALRPAAIRSLEAVDPNLTCNVCGSGDGADSMLLCDNFCAGGCPSQFRGTPDCATKAPRCTATAWMLIAAYCFA